MSYIGEQIFKSGVKVLGVTEHVTDCDCCGKSDLRRTVAIESLVTGVINYYGTVCAAKVQKWNSQRVADEIKAQAAYCVRYKKFMK